MNEQPGTAVIAPGTSTAGVQDSVNGEGAACGGLICGTAKKAGRVRDRIFATARELFSRHGVRGVGVDAIACEAGTNKMSFYRNFASKDDLVAECLSASESEFWAWWDAQTQPHAGDPRRQIEALFDGFVTKVCTDQDRTRGCALANAVVEITEEDHPGRQVAVAFKAEVRRRLQLWAHELGAREPEMLGDALLLLMDGCYLSRLAFGDKGPVRAAGGAARALIAAQLAPPAS